MDFDDLLLLVVRLFGTPGGARLVPALWSMCSSIVPGHQPRPVPLVQLLTQEHRNLRVGAPTVRVPLAGADLEHLDFEKDFDCSVVALEQNYRSTKRILRMASAVIQHNTARKDKTLWTENAEGETAAVYRAWDENEEAGFVARAIRDLHDRGGEYRDAAIFYRTNAQSRVLEDALRRASLPYLIVGGVRFYGRREIKDVVAYLRLVVNPRDDVAFRRAVAAPSRGIGRTTLDHLDALARRSAVGLLAACDTLPPEITAKPRKALQELAGLVARLGERRAALPLPAFIDECWPPPATARRSRPSAPREPIANLRAASEEFLQSGGQPRRGALEAFLTHLARGRHR